MGLKATTERNITSSKRAKSCRKLNTPGKETSIWLFRVTGQDLSCSECFILMSPLPFQPKGTFHVTTSPLSCNDQ